MVSVVIPTLNEAGSLPAILTALEKAAGGTAYEVIVADGGSTDGTGELAGTLGCRCVRWSRAQRAAQMNAGAALADGSVLLFLHADTLLPVGALAGIEAACARPGVAGGGFARRYDSPSRWLRLTCWLAEGRNRWFGWHLGDQAIFVRRPVFEQLGGFRDLDLFEDVDFSRRLGRMGSVVTLQPPVLTSARRFRRRGPFRTSLADIGLTLEYLARGGEMGTCSGRVDRQVGVEKNGDHARRRVRPARNVKPMELFEAIVQRRTIKDFQPDAVPAALLERALAAGVWAQNHKLTEPWRFTLLGPETHRRLAERFAQGQAAAAGETDATRREQIRREAAGKILSKPCVVAVSQRLEGSPAQRREDYGAIACAIQNIQLAAWAGGLGMQWSSGKIIGRPETYEVLAIDPAREEIVGLLFFGFPASVPAAQARKPLAEVSRRLP